MATVLRPVNPENEALRKNVGGPPDMKEIIDLLLKKTYRIHAAFLFESCNREALQKLCQLLSATRTTHQYKGWESFGSKIGLNSEQIKCIDFHFNMEDPAYYTLKVFVQRRDSTLDQIVIALKSIGRHDIIIQMKDHFIHLAEEVIRNNDAVGHEESGYFSLPDSTEQQPLEQTTVIVPTFFPSVPLVFQDFGSSQLRTNITVVNTSTFRQESFQTSPSSKINQPKYAKKVMFTFASDGEDIAYKVASVFRKEKDDKQKIGVVILNEHADKVNACPEQFIFSCSEQVDYLIPIITEGYLQTISTQNLLADVCSSSLQCIDPRYAKYIYTLMVSEYMRNACINNKVRCIIPDSLLHLTHQHFLMKSPLFQAWVKQSEAEELSLRIFRSNF